MSSRLTVDNYKYAEAGKMKLFINFINTNLWICVSFFFHLAFVYSVGEVRSFVRSFALINSKLHSVVIFQHRTEKSLVLSLRTRNLFHTIKNDTTQSNQSFKSKENKQLSQRFRYACFLRAYIYFGWISGLKLNAFEPSREQSAYTNTNYDLQVFISAI